MDKLSFQSYRALRENAYAQAGIIGDTAEKYGHLSLHLADAYSHSCDSLDSIDQLGYELGYLNSDTNEYTEYD